MDEGYLRQRRNLISISILILLTTLAGTEINLLFPRAEFKNPGVAEFFIWIGFSYFWYRTRIYEPNLLKECFRQEVIISYLNNINPRFLLTNRLHSFIGDIEIAPVKDGGKPYTRIRFVGKNDAGEAVVLSAADTFVSADENESTILSKSNKIDNILHGKTFTNYYLPHYIAFITLFTGIIAKYDLDTWNAIGVIIFLILVSKIE